MTNEISDDRARGVRHARDSGGRLAEEGVVRQLSELARELRAEPDMSAALNHIVAATVAEIDGAEQGGITLVEGRRVRAVGATSPVVNRLDELQAELDEGPCLNALREQTTILSNDFKTENRWPAFVAAAMKQGVRAMLSVQLFVEGDNLGALNLYATTPDAFTGADEYTAMALAAHAAVAMKGNRVEDNLRTALASRDVIGQAKGILMERYKINSQEAFSLLIMASQQSQQKLNLVAADLAASGELNLH